MAYNVYDNPSGVTIGSTSLTGVVSIAVQETYREVHAAADTDTHEAVARYATGSTDGVITFLDPVQAELAKDMTGTLTFTAHHVNGTTDIDGTIANCSMGGFDANAARDSASNATVPFVAESALSWS